MKFARLVCIAFAVTMIAGWATLSFAGDKDKAAAASAAHASGACTAEMAAKCTPEMAAACKAKMTAAAASSPTTKATAVTASASGACNMKGMKATAVTASASGACNMKGMKATAAATAAANGAGSTKGMGASAAAGQCNSHGMGAMAAMSAHDDCEACLDMSSCSDALDDAGAHRQAVRLKNGVMYVYTADSPGNVSAVQAAVARRGEHMAQLASAGDKARLCAECKSMRGAMASGKLTREVVNIEGGSLTLITSTDRAVVAKIHAMTDQKVAARTKS
ncbi:MAG: hypothetical protein AAB113_00180 [Candidatus Eisenbacteria bacterium]